MANTAFRAADAHSLWAGGALESTLRMKCTMHRWYLVFGSIEPTVATSPSHRSPTTSLMPFSPRSIMERKHCSQLSLSSFMPSVTPMTSRCPSASTPMATRTLMSSTRRVDTPARYISISASSTLDSRLR